jgi:preprotein translocase subunit Sec63
MNSNLVSHQSRPGARAVTRIHINMNVAEPPSEEKKTHYEILGVSADATVGEIKRAYKSLSLASHPDKTASSDASAFQRISAAYEVLKDADKRRWYDLYGDSVCEAISKLRCVVDVNVTGFERVLSP